MNENLTEIVFILDRSGSMRNLTSDTIGGFNSFIDGQKKESGKARLTTILFDDRYEVLHDGVDLNKVPELTDKEYYTRGMTAYLDALGKTINSVGERLANTPEDERPSKVIFVITTDGYENASKEFTSKKQIKEMIEHQENKYNWKFIFLSANMDAISVGADLGIAMAANYVPSSGGTRSMYASIGETITAYRKGEDIQTNWNTNISEDE